MKILIDKNIERHFAGEQGGVNIIFVIDFLLPIDNPN